MLDLESVTMFRRQVFTISCLNSQDCSPDCHCNQMVFVDQFFVTSLHRSTPMLLPCQRQVPALVIHLAWTLCLLTMVSPSAAQLSATISVERSDAGNGRFLYEYEIVNDPASEVSINAFVLDVGNGADLASLEGPENWTLDYSPEEISFEYAAVSGGPQFDIDVGSSATFSFTSPLESDLLDYFLANVGADAPGDS